ncbi:uncharacterized protein [Eucyclogobius newberryi]|uniref:uncharacterized protein n=1 Tax=Eucyclogobius newberryi TaxID=166745 RepID=UPI003B5CE483
MAKHNVSLLVTILLSLLFFVITMVFTALASTGLSPFLQTTANISSVYTTEITPSGWTFSIWGIIYAFVAAALVYILSGLCRKNAYGYVYCSPPVLPRGFFVMLCLNLSLNLGWLLLWDRRLMIPALIFLIFIALTNYAVIAFSCLGLHTYGAWLNKNHKVDLYLIRVLVQNGIAIYATWTTVASLVNLNVVLTTEAKMSQSDASTTTLAILTVIIVTWFVLENWLLEKHVRYIVSIYPAVIWALTGVFTNNYDAAAPTTNNTFIAALLGVGCCLCVTRIGLVVWRHLKYPLYKNADTEDISPMEVAKKQKKIFK